MKSPRSAPLIALLALFFLVAMASAIPVARPAIQTDRVRGGLYGHSVFSARLAEQLARSGYSHLAIDITTAQLGGRALWIDQFKSVSALIQVWGWLDLGDAGARANATRIISGYNFAGIYVYGPGALDEAAAMARLYKDKQFIPVLHDGEPVPETGRYGVAFELEEFKRRCNDVALPVLIAAQLDVGQIAEARAVAEGDYLVGNVSILPPGK